MVQEIIVGIIFLAATIYAGYSFWRQTKATSSGCGSSCGCETSKEFEKLKKKKNLATK